MTDIKHIDIKEFREIGFLQEANRLFFHPHGLALEITIVDQEFHKMKVAQILAAINEGWDLGEGDWTEIAQSIVEAQWPLGSDILSGVWDFRDDDEGVWFAFNEWPEGHDDGTPTPLQKATNVRQERLRHMGARIGLFVRAYDGQQDTSQPQILTSIIEPIPKVKDGS